MTLKFWFGIILIAVSSSFCTPSKKDNLDSKNKVQNLDRKESSLVEHQCVVYRRSESFLVKYIDLVPLDIPWIDDEVNEKVIESFEINDTSFLFNAAAKLYVKPDFSSENTLVNSPVGTIVYVDSLFEAGLEVGEEKTGERVQFLWLKVNINGKTGYLTSNEVYSVWLELSDKSIVAFNLGTYKNPKRSKNLLLCGNLKRFKNQKLLQKFEFPVTLSALENGCFMYLSCKPLLDNVKNVLVVRSDMGSCFTMGNSKSCFAWTGNRLIYMKEIDYNKDLGPTTENTEISLPIEPSCKSEFERGTKQEKNTIVVLDYQNPTNYEKRFRWNSKLMRAELVKVSKQKQ